MYKILEYQPELRPWEGDINLRMGNYDYKLSQALQNAPTLNDFANAHEWYGFHREGRGWVYREWAPAADGVYLTGDFNDWHWLDTPLTRIEGTGDWEVHLKAGKLKKGSRVKTIVKNGENLTEHLPLYCTRAVQDEETKMWTAEVWDASRFKWTDQNFKCDEPPLIYEAHVGMATEELRVGTYREFADNILPRIKKDGYNTVQLMAIMEHPYYGSFGYQVSNFFAASSRFGTPEDLKYLVNKAHKMGLRVLMDLVHSHAVKNTLEGINLFDGTTEQFFYSGAQGEHEAWGTKCFNYGKIEVIHFLLSNLKFWLTEYHLDGFRFDGVTSMLYWHHGLGVDYTDFSKYFSMSTNTDAVTYLQLANKLIREVKPDSITIAEDMSGMPGMCFPIEDGGIGFDYRLGMGLPDKWIKLAKEVPDEYWNMGSIWWELANRNAGTIAYVESHDQALVGDKTMIFRLADANMYTDMEKTTHNLIIDRATALHKMIRLITLGAGGDGYLNFMGNEFGHPEWIDFPREGNGWSYYYCRRQWSLVDNDLLKYQYLGDFDREMIQIAKDHHILEQKYPYLRKIHEDDKVVAFERQDLMFIFNFHPTKGFSDYDIPVPTGTEWETVFTTDDFKFGGYGRIEYGKYCDLGSGEDSRIRVYMPPRTAIVLKRVKDK
jgi:1,4-alpha-glucan branching enzyme